MAGDSGLEKAISEERSDTSDHIMIGGQDVSYDATAGTMLLRDDKNKPAALMFYTAYTRTPDAENGPRPIAFVFNGGPGSPSMLLHMGAFGPKRIKTTDAAPTPPPPYDVVDNENSLLDKTDIVFIDPVGTGFSHVVGKGEGKNYWGVDQDINSLRQFISRYVSRNDRWDSPKFIIGESYGTFRAAGLVNALQSQENMNFNGVVLLSNVLDFNTVSFAAGADLTYSLYLPTYAATAWYHGLVKDCPADLETFLAEAREFASGEYALALMKGAKLGETERAAIAEKLAHFTGLSADYVLKANLRVTKRQFMAELQRDRGLTTGRLDSRFSGLTNNLLQSEVSRDALSDAINGAFVAAVNRYIRTDLKYNPDQPYELHSQANSSWDWKHRNERRSGFPGPPNRNMMDDLAQAMMANPGLQVEVENSYYDLATPFFASEYTMDHLDLPDALRDHITMKYYESGHMMYLREEDLAKLKNNIAGFIDRAVGPAPRGPALRVPAPVR